MLLLGEGARIAGREAGALGSPHPIDPGTQWLPEAEYKLAENRTPPPCPPPPDQQGQVTSKNGILLEVLQEHEDRPTLRCNVKRRQS